MINPAEDLVNSGDFEPFYSNIIIYDKFGDSGEFQLFKTLISKRFSDLTCVNQDVEDIGDFLNEYLANTSPLFDFGGNIIFVDVYKGLEFSTLPTYTSFSKKNIIVFVTSGNLSDSLENWVESLPLVTLKFSSSFIRGIRLSLLSSLHKTEIDVSGANSFSERKTTFEVSNDFYLFSLLRQESEKSDSISLLREASNFNSRNSLRLFFSYFTQKNFAVSYSYLSSLMDDIDIIYKVIQGLSRIVDRLMIVSREEVISSRDLMGKVYGYPTWAEIDLIRTCHRMWSTSEIRYVAKFLNNFDSIMARNSMNVAEARMLLKQFLFNFPLREQ